MLKQTIVYIVLLGLLLVVSCNGRQPVAETEPQKPEFDAESPTWLPINPKAYEYVSSVEDFGDSLRIITTKPPGDTVFSYHLDLKGTSDDKFDGTFTVKSTFRYIPNDTTVNTYKSFEDIGEYRFYYDPKEMDSLYPGYRNRKNTDPIPIGWIGIPKFFEISPLRVINPTTQEKPRGILIEQYVTEFSGGKQVHVITANNDTMYLEGFVDYMK